MKRLMLTLMAWPSLSMFGYADSCKTGDRVIVQRGYLLFEDRHKQEDMSWSGKTSPADIRAAIAEGDCVMLKHPVEATVIAEVGEEIQIEQDGGMTWWTTKMAVRLARYNYETILVNSNRRATSN